MKSRLPVETYSISRVIADPHFDAARLLKDRAARYKDTTWTVEFSYIHACRFLESCAVRFRFGCRTYAALFAQEQRRGRDC